MRILPWLLPLVLEGLGACGLDHPRRHSRRLTFEQQVVRSKESRGCCRCHSISQLMFSSGTHTKHGGQQDAAVLSQIIRAWCSGAFRNNSVAAAAAAQRNRQRAHQHGYQRRTPVPAHINSNRPPAYNPEVAPVGNSTPGGSIGRAVNVMDEAPVCLISWPYQQAGD